MKQYFYIIPLLIFLFIGLPEFNDYKQLPDDNKKLPNDSIFVSNNSNNLYNNPYITNFGLKGIIDKQIWSIAQDEDGLMLFANSRGIITYDSHEYNFIKTPGVPYVIEKDTSSNIIYVGCNNGIGYLEKENNKYQFIQLYPENEKIIDVDKIIFNSENIYFYSDNIIIRINKNDYTKKTLMETYKQNSFYGIFEFQDTIYVNYGDKGLRKVKQSYVAPQPSIKFNPNEEILFSVNKNENEIILGTNKDRLYLFDGKNTSLFETDARDFLTENYIINGIQLSDSKFAVSTLGGGVLIIDSQTGTTVQILNYLTGLPDDEVYSLGLDRNNGLWLSHAFGISRVDFNIPVKNYSNYLGLDGRIISSIMYDTTLYVITTDGAYFLTKPKNKSELDVVVKKNKSKQDERTNTTQFPENEIVDIEKEESIQSDNTPEENKKEGGLLKRWKKKRNEKRNKRKEERENKDNEDNNNEDNNETENNETDTLNITDPIIDTSEVEIDIHPDDTYEEETFVVVTPTEISDITFKFYYYFKKIEGIDQKCKQIIKHDDKLLVSTNNGLFEIFENKSRVIIKDKYITKIAKSKNKNRIYVASNSNFDILEYQNNKQYSIKTLFTKDSIDDNIFSIYEDEKQNLWLGGQGYAYYVEINAQSEVVKTNTYELNPEFLQKVIIKPIGNIPFFYVSDGIYEYDAEKDEIIISEKFDEATINTLYYIDSQRDYIWYKEKNNWLYHTNNDFLNSKQYEFLKLFEQIRNIKYESDNNIWIIDGYQSIYKILNQDKREQNIFEVYIEDVFLDSVEISKTNIKINYKDNTGLNIKLSSPYYLKKESNLYQFYIEGSMQSWSKWNCEPIIPIHVSSGKYVIRVRAKNVLGQMSAEKTLDFIIKPPFWQATWFYILIGLGVIIISLFIIFISIQTLKKRNRILEDKVRERTQHIEQQNQEIQAQSDELHKHNSIITQQNEELIVQRDEIQNQHDIVIQKNDRIAAQNREITESITYASRIQEAVLPTTDILQTYFSGHFVINLPRDVVSGDFYWLKEMNNKLIITVADCTGHGVPGAFLSMLGSAFLSEIVSHKHDINANDILNILRNRIIGTLKESSENKRHDGMDMALCVFDFDKNYIQIAGAYNPVFIIRDEKLISIDADKMPVGFHRKQDISFKNQIFDFKKDDLLYMFSDGIIDQFGGKHGRKFRKANFKKLLLMVAEMELDDQKDIILQTYLEWKGNLNQLDDILLIGLKI